MSCYTNILNEMDLLDYVPEYDGEVEETGAEEGEVPEEEEDLDAQLRIKFPSCFTNGNDDVDGHCYMNNINTTVPMSCITYILNKMDLLDYEPESDDDAKADAIASRHDRIEAALKTCKCLHAKIVLLDEKRALQRVARQFHAKLDAEIRDLNAQLRKRFPSCFSDEESPKSKRSRRV